jgi:opacity protein-like surface antigen
LTVFLLDVRERHQLEIEEIEEMPKLKLFQPCFWAIFLLLVNSVWAEEVRREAQPATSDGKVQKEKTNKSFGLGVGLHSTYFNLLSSERFRGVNRVEEQQDYAPTQVTLNYKVYEWMAEGIPFQLALEGEAFLKPLVGKTINEGFNWGDGDLKWTPYILSLQMRAPKWKGFVPYLSFGVAYIKTDFNTAWWYENGYDTPELIHQARGKKRYYEMDDSTWGWSVGGGTDYFFTKNLALNLDMKFLFATVKFTYEIYVNQIREDQDHGQFSLDSLMIALGLKYYF